MEMAFNFGSPLDRDIYNNINNNARSPHSNKIPQIKERKKL
jgi:hypothetical protein